MSDERQAPLPDGRLQVHLAGFMGSGKSTVGRLLARRLLWNFLDLDAVIERHEGKPIAQIFEDAGEAHFRSAESHVLRQVVGKPYTVVALGGGTLIDAGNRELCRGRGAVVWLRCSLDVLEARLKGEAGERPLWGDREALEERYAERVAGYEAAEIVVDGSGEPQVVAESVLATLFEG